MNYSKYHNKKAVFNGIKFDSIKEKNRYIKLLSLEQKGIIKDLILQPRFLLQEKFKTGTTSYRKIEYVSDFQYMKDEQIIVEDVKGFKTDIYKLKKKLFLYKYRALVFIET